MKVKLIALLVVIAIIVGGFYIFGQVYNRQIWDFTYSYERAVIWIPGYDEIVEGRVESWRDFDDGDQIQVRIDGKTYLTHMANVVLISE